MDTPRSRVTAEQIDRARALRELARAQRARAKALVAEARRRRLTLAIVASILRASASRDASLLTRLSPECCHKLLQSLPPKRGGAMPYPPDAPEKISRKLDDGTLPRDASSTMLAGYGDGKSLCAGCEAVLLREEVEWEFSTTDGNTIRFHLGCAGVWEAERRKRGWLPPRSARRDVSTP